MEFLPIIPGTTRGIVAGVLATRSELLSYVEVEYDVGDSK